tara:strand:+ start:495 stop:926 length:432 start_codon:yes stop_codon:yes gene_type:complete
MRYRPLVGSYMAKDMYRALALFIAILLTGCAYLKYQPESGLVKIQVQKLVPTEDCSGKGIRAYSARGANKHHLLKKEVFYVSPGNWEISYYPTYEELKNGVCEEMERLIIHGEYTISHEFKHGFNYFIYLNNELEAGIKQNAI